MLLDIVILPPQELRQKIGRKMKDAMKGVSSVFFVDNKRLIPHLSLFHISTSPPRIKKLEKIVSNIVNKYRPLQISSTKFMAKGKNGGFELSNTTRLKKLNREMVAACYELRTGSMPWTSENNPTALQRRNRKKYGTQHNIGKAFRPHFTMFKLKDERHTNQIVAKMDKIKFSFIGDTIAICEVDFWHQVTRVLKTFKLR